VQKKMGRSVRKAEQSRLDTKRARVLFWIGSERGCSVVVDWGGGERIWMVRCFLVSVLSRKSESQMFDAFSYM